MVAVDFEKMEIATEAQRARREKLTNAGLAFRGNFGWYIEPLIEALGRSCVAYAEGDALVRVELETALNTWLELHLPMDLVDYLRQMFPQGLPVVLPEGIEDDSDINHSARGR